MNARARVVALLGALSNPDVPSVSLARAVGQVVLDLEDATFKLGAAMAALEVRLDRLEAAARRPLLELDSSSESSS